MKGLVLGCFYALVAFCACTANAYAGDNQLWLDAQKTPPQVELTLPSFAPIIEKLGGAVVNISIEGREEVSSPFGPDQFGSQREPNGQVNPFEFFFQVPPEKRGKRPFQSLGSGFVINSDGYIITNNHVVDKATKITVKFKDDKNIYEAKVVGRDLKTDFALLKVDGA